MSFGRFTTEIGSFSMHDVIWFIIQSHVSDILHFDQVLGKVEQNILIIVDLNVHVGVD